MALRIEKVTQMFLVGDDGRVRVERCPKSILRKAGIEENPTMLVGEVRTVTPTIYAFHDGRRVVHYIAV